MELYRHIYIVSLHIPYFDRGSIALILTSTNNVIFLLSLTVLKSLYELYALKKHVNPE